jgi:hypothetical protein
MNYSNAYSQWPESCEPQPGCKTDWSTDTMTVEIPGYSGCFAFVTYDFRVCESGLVQFKITSMNFLTASCYVFQSLLFPYGTSNPPNEIFLRQNWNNILEVVMINNFQQLWDALPSPFRNQFYCDENIRMFQYTTYTGYCQKYCLGVFNKTNPAVVGPSEFYNVYYQDCDNTGCCINLVEYCINRATGKAVKYSQSVQTSGTVTCTSNQTSPGCFFFSFPNYSFVGGSTGYCTNTCNQN